MTWVKVQLAGRYLQHHQAAHLGRMEYSHSSLVHRKRLVLLGVPVWTWDTFVRDVPVHEWAKSACFGEDIPDEEPEPRIKCKE